MFLPCHKISGSVNFVDTTVLIQNCASSFGELKEDRGKAQKAKSKQDG